MDGKVREFDVLILIVVPHNYLTLNSKCFVPKSLGACCMKSLLLPYRYKGGTSGMVSLLVSLLVLLIEARAAGMILVAVVNLSCAFLVCFGEW